MKIEENLFSETETQMQKNNPYHYNFILYWRCRKDFVAQKLTKEDFSFLVGGTSFIQNVSNEVSSLLIEDFNVDSLESAVLLNHFLSSLLFEVYLQSKDSTKKNLMKRFLMRSSYVNLPTDEDNLYSLFCLQAYEQVSSHLKFTILLEESEGIPSYNA